MTTVGLMLLGVAVASMLGCLITAVVLTHYEDST